MGSGSVWPGTAIERPATVAIYLAGAHAALVGLGVMIAWRPDALAATPAHPLAVAMTHALTLGWITASILGALYAVLPLALAARLTVRRADVPMALLFLAGAGGVVAATAAGRNDLVAGPGACCAITLVWVFLRTLLALRRSSAPRTIRAHVALAFASVLLAVALAIAWSCGSLPVPRAAFVTAHAHLGAVGFAVTMAIGIGHRLLPMFLPATPRGACLQWATLLVPLGAMTLATAALFSPSLLPVGQILIGAGLVTFFVGVVRLLLDGRPPPRDLVRPDPGKIQILFAVASLLGASVVGTMLACGAGTPRLEFAYGALGLLGFLGQLVAGVGLRLFPTLVWAHAWRRRAPAGAPPPTSPVCMPARPLVWVGLAGMAGAVVLLTTCAGTPRLPGVRAAGIALAIAGLALTANLVWLRRERLPALADCARGDNA